MKVSFEIGEKHFLFLVGILAVVSAIGIVTGQTSPNPGHGASGIGPGNFQAGDYVFPNNLDVGGNLDVSGNLDGGGNVTGAFIECPSGFTSVESQGRQLGCIQNAQQSPATCQNAILSCFDNNGGRLPSYSEIYVAFQRFSSSLSGVGSANEWIDVAYLDYYWSTTAAFRACGIIDSAFVPYGSSYNSNIAYRCWIPN